MKNVLNSYNTSYNNYGCVRSLLMLLLAIIIYGFVGLVIWLTWNYVCPSIFGFGEMTYWQTLAFMVCLVLVSNIARTRIRITYNKNKKENE